MRKLLKEIILPETYEEYTNQLQELIDTDNSRDFERLIKESIKKRKFEWFATFYAQKDQDGDLTKHLFKRLKF